MASWIPVVVALVSAIGAIAAAVIAGRAAARTKQAELDAARIVELEKRLATAKAGVFEPMVEAMGNFFDLVAKPGPFPADKADEVLGTPMRTFMNWVQVYGTDRTVRTAMHLMQAMYHDAPPLVLSRLLGELLVELRRELGDPETTLGSVDILAIRMNDAYTDAEHYANLTEPLEHVFARYNWMPPCGCLNRASSIPPPPRQTPAWHLARARSNPVACDRLWGRGVARLPPMRGHTPPNARLRRCPALIGLASARHNDPAHTPPIRWTPGGHGPQTPTGGRT